LIKEILTIDHIGVETNYNIGIEKMAALLVQLP